MVKTWGPNELKRKWLNDMKAVLLGNMLAGDKVQKDRIPRLYLAKYGIHHLYHYEHPQSHRSSYMILNEGKGAFVLVIDLLNHHDYNKKFGYD